MTEHSFVKFVPNLYVVYLSVPKAGSSSISYAMLKMNNLFNDIDVYEHSLLGKALTNRQSVMLPKPDLPIFTFVRHPIVKFLSYYQNKFVEAKNGEFELIHLKKLGFSPSMTLEEVVDYMLTIPVDEMEHHAQPQSNILIKHGELLPDYVGKLESLATEWDNIEAMALNQFKLTQVRNQSRFYRESGTYSQAVMDKLIQYYRNDLFLFDYSVEGYQVTVENEFIVGIKNEIKERKEKWLRTTARLSEDKIFKHKYHKRVQEKYANFLTSQYKHWNRL